MLDVRVVILVLAVSAVSRHNILLHFHLEGGLLWPRKLEQYKSRQSYFKPEIFPVSHYPERARLAARLPPVQPPKTKKRTNEIKF